MLAEIHGIGGEGPPMLYVPGIDGTGELLFQTAETLEQRFRLVRLRYRCRSPEGATYSNLAASVVEAADRELDEPYVVLAESFGGAVALTCALDHPERVRALVLVNTFAYFPKRLSLWWSRVTMPLVPRFVFGVARQLWGPLVLCGGLWERDVVRRFWKMDSSFWGEGYVQRLHMIRGLDLRPRLPEITQPVRIYASTLDLVVPSLATSAVLERGLRHAEVERVLRGGHMILPLQRLHWKQRLGDFVERLP